MKNIGIKGSLYLNYFVFAILLNTVGIVILQVINDYNVSRVTAGSLEAYKDLSIMILSFFVASYIPKLGYKRSMLGGLLAVNLVSTVNIITNAPESRINWLFSQLMCFA